VGQGERGKEKVEKKESYCQYFNSNNPPLMAYKIKNLREKEFWAIWGQILKYQYLSI